MNKSINAFLQYLVPCALAVGLLAGCQLSAATLSSADVDAVKANYTDWGTAAGKRDYETMSRLLASDLLITNPHETPMTGREAAIAWVKTWAPDMKQRWDVHEVLGHSDLAYSRATVVATHTGPDGRPVTERFMSVNLHRRQPDGRWVFARCVNFSIDPLPVNPGARQP